MLLWLCDNSAEFLQGTQGTERDVALVLVDEREGSMPAKWHILCLIMRQSVPWLFV